MAIDRDAFAPKDETYPEKLILSLKKGQKAFIRHMAEAADLPMSEIVRRGLHLLAQIPSHERDYWDIQDLADKYIRGRAPDIAAAPVVEDKDTPQETAS